MGYTQATAFVDGELVPISEAKISLLDGYFLHSDATYDIATKCRGCWLASLGAVPAANSAFSIMVYGTGRLGKYRTLRRSQISR